MSINNMMSKFCLLIIFFQFSSCTINRSPFSLSLQNALKQFSKENPEYKVIQVQSSQINGHNLLLMTGTDAYDPELIDGYYIYNGKLVTYFQTDSIDRARIVDIKKMQSYKGRIDGYANLYQMQNGIDPVQKTFIITNEHKVSEVPKGFSLSSKKKYVDSNVIRNTPLKKYIYDYIISNPDVLYEMRFKQEAGKQYVIFRPMIFYDSLQCNGYFVWDEYLIVLYNISQSGNLLSRKNIVHSHRVPNRRAVSIKNWDFPYPIKLEIINNKHLKKLSLEEGYFL